jgi:hypothetical protein
MPIATLGGSVPMDRAMEGIAKANIMEKATSHVSLRRKAEVLERPAVGKRLCMRLHIK